MAICHGKIGLLATRELSQGRGTWGRLIIHIWYHAGLSPEAKNHIKSTWPDSDCVSLEVIHSLEAMYVLSRAPHATFPTM